LQIFWTVFPPHITTLQYSNQSFLCICRVSVDAVRMNSPTSSATNRMVEDKIKRWLRQARDRDGWRKRRFTAASRRDSSKRNRLELSTDNDDSDIESTTDSVEF